MSGMLLSPTLPNLKSILEDVNRDFFGAGSIGALTDAYAAIKYTGPLQEDRKGGHSVLGIHRKSQSPSGRRPSAYKLSSTSKGK